MNSGNLRLSSLLFLLIFSTSASLWAEEDLYFSDLPIVASVSRLPQKLADAPTSVTVIDRDIIKASGARDLNDVFRLVPGFQTYPNNTETARVAYHGLNDDEYSPRVQVMVDGRSLYSPLFRNGVNWGLMPVAIEDIERIEVVRGSNNVSYGTNAFLGVINIITVDSGLSKGFSVSTNQGNQGVHDYTLRAGGKLGEAGTFRFTYQQRDDDGLRDQFDWKSFYKNRLLDFRADVQVSPQDSLEFSIGRVETTTVFGRFKKSGVIVLPVEKPDDAFRDYQQANTHLQAQWRRVLGENSEFKLRYAFSEDWATDAHRETKDNYGPDAYLNVDAYGGRSRTHDLEAQHAFSPLDNFRLSWGGSWRFDSLSTPDYLYGRDEVDRSVSRIFGNLEWKPVHWFTGNAGLSIERDSLAGTHESPRVSGNFHLNSENTVRVGYGKAYRTGSIIDYVGDRRHLPYAWVTTGASIPLGSLYRRRFLGDPNMPAEKLETLEVGYLGDWKDQRMSLDVRVFQEKIPNRLLTPVERVLADGYCNALSLPPTCSGIKADYTTPIQSVKTQGVEYQWRWQPFDSTRLMLSQAFIHIDSEFLPGFSAAKDKMLQMDALTRRSAPTHTTSMLLMQKLPYGLDFSLAGYWLGNHRWSQNTEVPNYQRLDARLGYPFNWAGQRGEIAYTVQSLNGEHVEYKGGNGNDADSLLAARIVERRSWLSLRLDF